MTAPVVNCLTSRRPGLALTVRSAASPDKLREHIHADFVHQPVAFDAGMLMRDALTVDVDRSLSWYEAWHADWDRRVDAATRELEALAPDCVLANVPYLSLAAARRIGVPAAALCCLNWADIFRHYLGDQPGAARIHAQIRDAYAGATAFLSPVPHMPMADLPNLRPVGPVGRVGCRVREALCEALGCPPDTRIALLSLGGFGFPLDVSRWPRLPGWRIVSGMDLAGEHPGVVPAARLKLPYVDVFASVDAVITKLGYGTVAEAGINGIPLLYVPRDGWPEEPHLAAWLETNGGVLRTTVECLLEGSFVPHLETLCARPAPPRVEPGGSEEVAGIIENWLGSRDAGSGG